jgi:hypothetical protein
LNGCSPLKNDRLTPIFRNLREASGHEVGFPENAAVRLLKALRNGTSVFLLTDLILKLRDAAVVIEEFGLKTRVTQLHAFLHLRRTNSRIRKASPRKRLEACRHSLLANIEASVQ